MKSNFKKALSLVLTVLMVFTVVPLSGFAVGEWECNTSGHKYVYTNIMDGKHYKQCSECSNFAAENCCGGTATCKDKAVCEKCKTAYGELSKTHGATTIVTTKEYLKTPANCQNAAVYYLVCTVCKGKTEETQSFGFEDPDAHVYDTAVSNKNGTHKATCKLCNLATESGNCYDAEPTVIEPTCTTGGHTKNVCDACGYEWTSDEKSANGHDFSEEIIDANHLKDEATCTAKATYWFDCKNCDVNAKNEATASDKYFSYGEMKAHDFTAEKADDKYLATAGTCQAEATYYKSCSVCGLSSKGTASEDTFKGAKGGHTWGDYTYNNDAKCGVDGTKTATCQTVGCTTTDTITAEGTALNHVFTKTDVATKDNLRSEATCTAKATYWCACANEGCTAFASEATAADAYFESGELTSHIYTSKIDNDLYNRTDATCLAKATRWYACTGCGKSAKDVEGVEKAYYEYGELKAHDYSQKVIEEKYIVEGHEPTCTTDGIYWYVCSQEGCTACAKDDTSASDKYYTGAGTAIGHNPVTIPAVEPTCTEDGSTEGTQCTICKTYLVEPIVRKATGHKEYVSKEKADPTCTRVGNTEEISCINCEKVITAAKTIDALGHVDSDGDDICDRCFLDISKTKDCSCICHQTGIMAIIYYIVRLIWKLVGANPYCECGIQHY